MIRTAYSDGFEKFWHIWCAVTANANGKPMAFKYWKRDKLEAEADELIDILRAQEAEKKRDPRYHRGCPAWPWCQKWLNERRYEYKPQITMNRRQRLCSCGCGKQACMEVGGNWYASSECRKKVEGW